MPSKGAKGLIHDDVLQLEEQRKQCTDGLAVNGGEILVQFNNFLMEIPFLNGRKKIKNMMIFSALLINAKRFMH
jgi:hypothetical protein